MKFNPTIFREYDIRGIAGSDLTEESMECLGKAYGAYLRGKLKHRCVAVGGDGRLTTRSFSHALMDGITSTGIDVIDLGQVPTPLVYFAMFTLKVDGGLVVTASHNTSEFNGLKVGVGQSTIHGKEIQRLRVIAEKGDFPKAKGPVTITRANIVPKYLNRVVRSIHLKRKLRVVVDAGNGVSGPIAVPLFERLGCEVIPLYCDVDGRFPNHHPDPTVPKNLKKIIATVKREKAHCGIAIDGDGDRVVAIDEKGNIMWGDQMLTLFARSVLKEKPGAAVIGEVKCSRTLYDDIAARGGIPIMAPTGHSIIKAAMKKHKAQLAGEMSGHMFFKHRWYGFDDAAYAGARLLEILAATRKPLSRLLADIPETFATEEIRIDAKEDRKFQIVKEATRYFQEELGLNVNTVDGARIEFDDGWGLLRASNTSAMLVMRCEATTRKRLREIKSLVEKKVAELNR